MQHEHSCSEPDRIHGAISVAPQVLDHLEAGAAAVTNREFCAMASVSERTGLRDLAELVERGVLVRLGKRKGARYRLATPPA